MDDDATTQSTISSRGPRLITVVRDQLTAPKSTVAFLGLAVGLVMLFLLLVCLSTAVGLPYGIAMATAAVVSAACYGLLRKIRSAELPQPDWTTGESVEAMVQRYAHRARHLLAGDWAMRLARFLVQRRQLELVICVGPQSFMQTIEPLTVPIEPLALDESQEAFRHLAGVEVDDAAPRSAFWGRPRKPVGWKQPMTLGGAVAIGLVVGVSVVLMQSLGLTGARGAWLGALVVGGLLGGLAGSVLRVRWSRLVPRYDWLIANGAIIIRAAQRGKAPWDITRVVPNESVLFVYQASSATWRAALAGQEKSWQSPRMTQLEAQMLLRAWLSPVPPPESGRLGDLE